MFVLYDAFSNTIFCGYEQNEFKFNEVWKSLAGIFCPMVFPTYEMAENHQIAQWRRGIGVEILLFGEAVKRWDAMVNTQAVSSGGDSNMSTGG